jgi:histidinol-phosphate aminotransferase
MNRESITKLVRENVLNLKPYSSARDEYTGQGGIFLDANENPFNEPYNRYPDPLQRQLKQKIGEIKNIPEKKIFIGNGSDEAIDILIRVFCEPGKDNIVTLDPSYGMYKVCADINNVQTKMVKLEEDFTLDFSRLKAVVDTNTKLVFICSPNNPTGNSFNNEKLIDFTATFNGIVIVDEAYIDFSPRKSLLENLSPLQNLVVLQTLSKSWGLAGIRLGMAFANDPIIDMMTKIKYPYNVNLLTQQFALKTLEQEKHVQEKWLKDLLDEKTYLQERLKKLSYVKTIYPSDANFWLIQVTDADYIYNYLIKKKIIIRNRSNVTRCEGCLRITVGNGQENDRLMSALKEIETIFAGKP